MLTILLISVFTNFYAENNHNSKSFIKLKTCANYFWWKTLKIKKRRDFINKTHTNQTLWNPLSLMIFSSLWKIKITFLLEVLLYEHNTIYNRLSNKPMNATATCSSVLFFRPLHSFICLLSACFGTSGAFDFLDLPADFLPPFLPVGSLYLTK